MKRTSLIRAPKSANDPKRTFSCQQPAWSALQSGPCGTGTLGQNIQDHTDPGQVGKLAMTVARPPGPRSTSMQEAEPLPSPLCGGGSALLQTTSVRTEALQQGHFEMTFRQTRAGGRSSFIARRTGTPSPLLNSVIQEGPADHQSSRQLCTANKSLSEFRLNL